MPLAPAQFSVALESFRRRQGQLPYSRDLTGGAQAATAPSAANPMAMVQGQAPQPEQGMMTEGIRQLGQSKPNESEIIVKALIKRLNDISQRETGGMVA